MRKEFLLLILICAGAVAAILFLKDAKIKAPTKNNVSKQSQSTKETNYVNESNNSMKIKSTAFSDNQKIPEKYTCDGLNVNPPLSIENVPSTAQSLVLVVEDPDAPAKIWTHWILFNISPETKNIEENSIPTGAIIGQNDFKNNNYGGPCPPSGIHRYNFILYALSSQLSLSEGTTKEELTNAMENLIISQDVLIGLYGK